MKDIEMEEKDYNRCWRDRSWACGPN